MRATDCILVTGGAGFIGANFVREWLASERAGMVNLDKLTYAGDRRTLAGLEADARHVFVRGDIADRALVRALLREHRPRAIVNFAAETHVDRSIDSLEAFVHTNVVGVSHLLEEARRYWDGLEAQAGFRFVQVSTDEVYGSLGPGEAAFTESTPYRPRNPYAATKASGDHLVRAYHHTYGLPALITNCSNNYGPYQYPEKLISVLVLSALEGRPLPVYGDGANVRDWLYVGDHCATIRRVLAAGRVGETYNIGGDCELTNLALTELVCRMLDEFLPDSPHVPHASLITFVADRPGHDYRYAMNAAKIRDELGWRPAESLESGLRKTLRWYLDNREWCGWGAGRGYRGERLGLGAPAGE